MSDYASRSCESRRRGLTQPAATSGGSEEPGRTETTAQNMENAHTDPIPLMTILTRRTYRKEEEEYIDAGLEFCNSLKSSSEIIGGRHGRISGEKMQTSPGNR